MSDPHWKEDLGKAQALRVCGGRAGSANVIKAGESSRT